MLKSWRKYKLNWLSNSYLTCKIYFKEAVHSKDRQYIYVALYAVSLFNQHCLFIWSSLTCSKISSVFRKWLNFKYTLAHFWAVAKQKLNTDLTGLDSSWLWHHFLKGFIKRLHSSVFQKALNAATTRAEYFRSEFITSPLRNIVSLKRKRCACARGNHVLCSKTVRSLENVTLCPRDISLICLSLSRFVPTYGELALERKVCLKLWTPKLETSKIFFANKKVYSVSGAGISQFIGWWATLWSARFRFLSV
jgi:hypothetical protein